MMIWTVSGLLSFDDRCGFTYTFQSTIWLISYIIVVLTITRKGNAMKPIWHVINISAYLRHIYNAVYRYKEIEVTRYEVAQIRISR